MAKTGEPINVHPGYRFTVAIDGVERAAFLECKMPSLQVETFDLKEGGLVNYVHRLPVRVNAGSVTLKHGVTRDHALLKWYIDVLNGAIKDAMRKVTVTIYGVDHKMVERWIFDNAYPVKWSGPQLKSSEAALAIEELEIAHHGFTVET